MKFRNGTENEIPILVKSGHNEINLIVKPGDEIDIPEEVGKRIGLAEINSLKVLKSSIGQTPIETKQIDYSAMEKEIDAIKGIGPKVFQEIKKIIDKYFGEKNG